jgi:hypothetical protein
VLIRLFGFFSPQSRRERNFIRIPERGILIKVSTILLNRHLPLFPKGLIHSIFPPLRGKYYKQNTQRSQRLKRAKRTGGKYYFLKVTFKKMELEFSIIHGSNPEVFP